MKYKTITSLIAALLISVAATAGTQPATYELTVTNGSQMPISPAVVYVKSGGESAAAIGTTATDGFIQLCQTGNTMNRQSELSALPEVTSTTVSNSLLLPGESQTFVVTVADPYTQSLQFEAMYGKTKDTCSIGSVNSHSLVALQLHVTPEIILRDAVLQAGAFLNPALPAMMTYPNLCPSEMTAVACLRDLALANMGVAKIRAFSAYLPSVVSALENRFGSDEVQSLIFADSGAVQLKLKLKH